MLKKKCTILQAFATSPPLLCMCVYACVYTFHVHSTHQEQHKLACVCAHVSVYMLKHVCVCNPRTVQIAYRNIGEFCEGAYIEFNKGGEFISEVGLV